MVKLILFNYITIKCKNQYKNGIICKNPFSKIAKGVCVLFIFFTIWKFLSVKLLVLVPKHHTINRAEDEKEKQCKKGLK